MTTTTFAKIRFDHDLFDVKTVVPWLTDYAAFTLETEVKLVPETGYNEFTNDQHDEVVKLVNERKLTWRDVQLDKNKYKVPFKTTTIHYGYNNKFVLRDGSIIRVEVDASLLSQAKMFPIVFPETVTSIKITDNTPLANPETGFKIVLPKSLTCLEFCTLFDQSIESLNFHELSSLKSITFGDYKYKGYEVSRFQQSLVPLTKLPIGLEYFFFHVLLDEFVQEEIDNSKIMKPGHKCSPHYYSSQSYRYTLPKYTTRLK